MLLSLRIENFTIVKHLELDFSAGMTVFTGETGAGKSIMIDALLLALGARAEASSIRPGEEKCDITACFRIEKNSEPALWLTANDLQYEDHELLLRRVLYAEGRSKSYINGQLFPLQQVKELGQMLVHIHGQHQHQTLMHHTTHRQQLDHYADHSDLLHEVIQLYKQCQTTKEQIETLQQQTAQTNQIQLLEFQINELNALNLQEGEVQILNKEHQLLHHAHDYLQQAQQITQLLDGEEEFNICSSLNQIIQLLSKLPTDSTTTKNANDLINNALIQCEEAFSEIHQFSEKIQLDPERLHEIESRISTLHHTARKYHIDVHQLPNHAYQLKTQLDQLKNKETHLEQLHQHYKEQITKYTTSAEKLRKSRQEQAPRLADEMTASIQQLGMPKGWIEIELTSLDKIQAHGIDKVEYKVCTNPGTIPDSLAKIASGGELSRISLAIQMVTAQKGSTPTLFFDEVDVGIGGATAALVGRSLRQLGERIQVFCVTHQPQVAACAHHHFRVEKHCDSNQTFSQIIALTLTEKVNEIARMLGGVTITEQTLAHANELLTTVSACISPG